MRGKASRWVWTNDYSDIDIAHTRLVYFRKTVSLPGPATKALIKVSADSRYRLYVNGVSVSFGPCKGDQYVWHHEEVDLAPYLIAGENALCAVVLRYPATNLEGPQAIWRTDTPGFYLEGNAELSDSSSIILDTDDSWRSLVNREIMIRPEGGLNFLWILEDAKGRADLASWQMPGFDDSAWSSVVPYSAFQMFKSISPGSITKRPIPPMYETPRQLHHTVCTRQSIFTLAQWDAFLTGKSPLTIPLNTREVVELDAGELTTGFLQLLLAGGEGCEVLMLTSECYAYPPKDQGNGPAFPRKGDRTDHVKGKLYGFTDHYWLSGHGQPEVPEHYEPFWFRTFRFIRLEITTQKAPLTLCSFTYRETGYPLEAKSWVSTSDPQMQGIWDISLRSLKRCMHETYEDCPFYEQLQYAMDTRSQILFTYMVSMDDRLARRCIDDFHRSLRPDGLTNCSYPAFGPNVIPGFSLFCILMLYDHMMYFGDKAFLRKYLPTMDAILDFFDRSLMDNGLVGKVGGPLGEKFWSFVDWAPQWSHTFGHPTAGLKGPLTVESLLYAHVLKAAAQILEYVDKPATASDYQMRADSVISSVNALCIGRDGLYQDGPGVEEYSQHAQVWAVLSNAVKGEEARQLMNLALTDASLTRCTVAMAFYLFRAVEQTGLYHKTQALWQPWREMLKNNLTTCVESPGEDARSDCHAWGALALYELPAVTLGIRPAKPGYAAVAFSPLPGYFQWAKGEVITPKGLVSVSWEMKEGQLMKNIQLPEGLPLLQVNEHQ